MSMTKLIGGTNDGAMVKIGGRPFIEMYKKVKMPPTSMASKADDTAVMEKEVYTGTAIRFPEGQILIYHLETMSARMAMMMVLDTYPGYPGERKHPGKRKHMGEARRILDKEEHKHAIW